jgi:dihydroxyacetone kinase
MKKIINDPMAIVDEMLEGILAAHGDQLKAASDPRANSACRCAVAGKVAILTGGGSGHLPVFMGYVGKGLADGASVGNGVLLAQRRDDV